MRFYGAEVFWSSHYPTRDRSIPYRLFRLLESSIEHLQAEEQLAMVQAHAYGQALAFGGTSPGIRRHSEALMTRAYPQVLIERPTDA